jgi:hypothetical protein
MRSLLPIYTPTVHRRERMKAARMKEGINRDRQDEQDKEEEMKRSC